MSQFCRPESVFTPSPVTLVGALVFGVAGVFFAGAVWAIMNPTMAKTRTMTAAIAYFVILSSLQKYSNRGSLPAGGELRSRSLQPIARVKSSEQSRQRNDVDLHHHVFGQTRNFDCGTRRRHRVEISAIDLCHGVEVVHVFQEHGGAHHFFQPTPRRFQNLRQITQHAVGLRPRVTGYHLLRRRIDWKLSRDKNESIGFDGLRIRTDGLRSVFGGNNFAHYSPISIRSPRRPAKAGDRKRRHRLRRRWKNLAGRPARSPSRRRSSSRIRFYRSPGPLYKFWPQDCESRAGSQTTICRPSTSRRMQGSDQLPGSCESRCRRVARFPPRPVQSPLCSGHREKG